MPESTIPKELGRYMKGLDEPTGNLDDENSDKIIDILKQLAHDQGFCVIIVTHDMEIAEESDHVWRIKDGTIELVK